MYNFFNISTRCNLIEKSGFADSHFLLAATD